VAHASLYDTGLVNFILGSVNFAISGVPLTEQQHRMLAGQRCIAFLEPFSDHTSVPPLDALPRSACMHALPGKKVGMVQQAL
jgi:hypothetical protein